MTNQTKQTKRHKIICIKCGASQSTYSTNRTKCHKCLPKCKERHYFPEQDQRRAKEQAELLKLKKEKMAKKAVEKTEPYTE